MLLIRVYFCFFIAVVLLTCFFFFFSSRRRHTRSLRDWSSDVCSSDLPTPHPKGPNANHRWSANALGKKVRNPDERSEEHTSELQSRRDLVCRLLLEKKKKQHICCSHLNERTILTVSPVYRFQLANFLL